jgi:23S rRNA pseudouridine2605 synthase
VLAQCGYGSLRGLEELIIAGRITINRQPAEVGQKVGPEDQVRINGELVRLRFAPPRVRVQLYHKPAGEIVSRSDPEGRPTPFDKLPKLGHAKWIAVGRLDFNTEGLLLFTTSGELANRLMHPRYEVEREYAVRTVGTLTPEQEAALLTGVQLDDGPAKVLTLADGGGEGTNHWYKVTLAEGRNREVRRIFEALGMMVSRLTRTRYGVVALPPQLKRGQSVEMERGELNALLKSAGLPALDEAREQRAGESSAVDGVQPAPTRGGYDAGGATDDLEAGVEVDGNRGTYGVPAEPDWAALDEVDGNRALPAPGAAKHAAGSRGRHGQHAHPRGPGAQHHHAKGPHSRGPSNGANQGRGNSGAPNQGRGRRGRRGGRGGRNGPGAPQAV